MKTKVIRITETAHKRLKNTAHKRRITLKQLVDELSAPRKRTPIVELTGV
jgi:predicted DNA-binding ribbon-helix-helix protein